MIPGDSDVGATACRLAAGVSPSDDEQDIETMPYSADTHSALLPSRCAPAPGRSIRGSWSGPLLVIMFGVVFALGTPNRLPADEPAAPAADPAATPAKPEEPVEDLATLARRLKQVERELLELRAKTGKIPDDPASRKLLVLAETPVLGAYYAGGAVASQRFFVTRAVLINLTADQIEIPRGEISLSVDGQSQPLQALSEAARGHNVQAGQQSVSLSEMVPPARIRIPSGGTASHWLAFDGMASGNHIPRLLLTVGEGPRKVTVDINAAQRDALALRTERMGPRQSLGVVRIGGPLDTVNVGSLLDALDALAALRTSRVLLCFEQTATIVDEQIVSWLANQAVINRNIEAEGGFPPIPATIRDFYLAALPRDANADQLERGYVGLTGRVFAREDDGVLAALSETYRQIPRDDLIATIETGSRLERAAALAGGGGRLPESMLARLIALTDDADPLTQSVAVAALRHFGEAAAIERLTTLVRKGDEPLATTAVASLAASRFPAAHDSLLAVLANEPPESKKRIVQELARHPRPVWSETLFEYVSDSRANLRSAALAALTQVGHPKLNAVLKAALSDPSPEYRQLAFSLLVKRADPESEALALDFTLARLATDDPTTDMLSLLGHAKDARAVPLLVKRLESTSNRSGVLQTLGIIGSLETAKAIDDFYPKWPAHDQAEALSALRRLDPVRFRRRAAEALATTDGGLISRAVQGLQEDSGPEAISILIEMLGKTTNPYTWSYLSNSLAVVATPEARAALVDARDNGNEEKREYARAALDQLKQRSPGWQALFQATKAASRKEWNDALEQFNLAIQQDPLLSDAYSGRADSYLQLKKFPEAGRDFGKAYELDPYNSIALTGQCIVLAITGSKCEEAVERAESGRGKFAKQPLYLYNLACVYGRSVEQVVKREASPERDRLLADYRRVAIESLAKSIELGFRDLKWMREDPDLQSLADLPEFKKLSSQELPAEEE